MWDFLAVFGFGLIIVTTIVRIGGSIFSKAIHVVTSQWELTSSVSSVSLVVVREPSEATAKDTSNEAKQVASPPVRVVLVADVASIVADLIKDIMATSTELADSTLFCLISALVVCTSFYGKDGMALPFYILSSGILASVLALGIFLLVSRTLLADSAPPVQQLTYRITNLFGSGLFLSFAEVCVRELRFEQSVFWCIAVGHAAGLLLELSFVMSMSQVDIVSKLKVGTGTSATSQLAAIGTSFIRALVVGVTSSLFPVISIFLVLFIAGHLNGVLGLVISALGWVATLILPLASHTIALTFRTARALEAIGGGNRATQESLASLCYETRAQAVAVQGWVSGAASLAACCLFSAIARLDGDSLDLHDDGAIIPGILIGTAFPFAFSALTMVALAHVGYM